MLTQAEFIERYEGVEEYDTTLVNSQRDDLEFLDELYNRLAIIGDNYGYWFDAHPDDGACFGFWKIEE